MAGRYQSDPNAKVYISICLYSSWYEILRISPSLVRASARALSSLTIST